MLFVKQSPFCTFVFFPKNKTKKKLLGIILDKKECFLDKEK